MTMRRIAAPLLCLVVLSISWVTPASGRFEQEVALPDLRPLLAQPQSEMRMVTQRYTLDRVALSGNYANGGVSIRTDNFQEIIQHDIPLGPADMGGPLLNLLGQAVGINIARVDRVTTFALPTEVFWPSVQQWIADDRHPPKAEPAASVANPAAKP